MRIFPYRRRKTDLVVYVDGAANGRGDGEGAAGAVAMTAEGHILHWASCQVRSAANGRPGVTNIEAEYAGLVLGIEIATRFFRPRTVEIRCDCEVVVRQMRGEFGVKSPAIKPWHRRACELARDLANVRYVHVRREFNQLANALAAEALRGQVRQGGTTNRR